MCFYNDYESVDCQRKTTPVARKEHGCDECGGNVKRGDRYHRWTGRWERETWYVTVVCDPCEQVRQAVARMEESRGCEGAESWCPIGGLSDYLRDEKMTRERVLSEYPPRLAPSAPTAKEIQP